MFVLKGVLRAETQEKILIYLLVREQGYGSSIADFFHLSVNATQKQLSRLENDGVLSSKALGRTRMYYLNPRYPFIEALKPLLKSALESYPQEIKSDLIMERKRPRKSEKAIVYASENRDS